MNAVICTLSYRPYRKEKTECRIIGQDLNGRKKLLKPKRTDASIHIPNIEETFSQVQEFSSSESDDSSGPEFVRLHNLPYKLQMNIHLYEF